MLPSCTAPPVMPAPPAVTSPTRLEEVQQEESDSRWRHAADIPGTLTVRTICSEGGHVQGRSPPWRK